MVLRCGSLKMVDDTCRTTLLGGSDFGSRTPVSPHHGWLDKSFTNALYIRYSKVMRVTKHAPPLAPLLWAPTVESGAHA